MQEEGLGQLGAKTQRVQPREKTVAVIYTGGTVGSQGADKPRIETSTSTSLKKHLEVSYPAFSYSHHHPVQILSEKCRS